MDLMLTDKVAVVTGAGKGIGLAVDAGAGRRRRVRRRRRHGQRRDLEGLDARHRRSRSTCRPRTAPAELVQRALDEHGRVDVLVNNVGAVKLRLDGFLATTDDDFAWAMNMNFFTTLRATRAALAADGGPRRRIHRQRLLGQRVLPTRRRHHRLRRRQGRGAQPLEVAGAGVRAAGHPRELRVTRAGEHRPLVRRTRRGRDRRGRDRCRRRHRP